VYTKQRLELKSPKLLLKKSLSNWRHKTSTRHPKGLSVEVENELAQLMLHLGEMFCGFGSV
jgi:hypothetical protein